MPTRWLTEDERIAWIRFAAVLELLPAALNSQLTNDEGLTHFDYFALAMLSEAPDWTLRMSVLAAQTSAMLPRLSRVMTRLEQRTLVERRPCPDDRRATDVRLTPQGWAKVVQAAPGHVANVRAILEPLRPEQLEQLSAICAQLLETLDPGGSMFSHVLPR